MTAERDGFPDDRDLAIQNEAESLLLYAEELTEWVGRHAEARRNSHSAISPPDEFRLLRWRRLANNLLNSSRVPVAAAVYGPSQVGKSLFMGRVLQPADHRDSPLGKDDRQEPDAYIRELSFDHDINPQSGSNEATALVTRFTTKDRFDKAALPEYPVKVRALSRAEWLRVLARGFRSECPPSSTTWEEGQIRDLFESTHDAHGADKGDRNWQMDLIDAYSYARKIDQRQYKIEESMFNSYLSQYPLTDAGYVEIAARLLWDTEKAVDIKPRLTELFNEVRQFLNKVTDSGHDGMLVHWGAVRFLLDSQRLKEQESKSSKWKSKIKWADFVDNMRDGWCVLDYAPGGRGASVDVSIIQSAMLEMIVPVIPHRLNGDWREVVKKMDVLDLPGMVAGGGDSQGRANTAKTLEEKMMIVKRGKVFYLIERYIEERQIQTLFLLMRGGNINVRQLLKEYVDQWGSTRFGDDAWPQKVPGKDPSLFVGMTGIDEEFELRDVDKSLYQNRLNNIVSHTLCEVMTDFGGPGKPFTNVFPVRYPGTWDADEARRNAAPRGGATKWDTARSAFLESELVQKHVRDAEKKWAAAMRDDDGGMSLICEGFLKCTSAMQKQDSLQQQVRDIHQTVTNLAKSWHVDPNANLDREKRAAIGNRVVDWLADEERVYHRAYALERSLCFSPGNAMNLAEFAEQRSSRGRREALDDRFPKRLHDFLKTWATEWAPQQWQEHVVAHEDGTPWLTGDDFGTFVRYLSDYLRSDHVFPQLNERLLKIVSLKIGDEGARRHVVREYVQLVLNDFVMNPGPSTAPLDPQVGINGHDFGLMNDLVLRWRQRMPLALASAAGATTEIPAGNEELNEILSQY